MEVKILTTQILEVSSKISHEYKRNVLGKYSKCPEAPEHWSAACYFWHTYLEVYYGGHGCSLRCYLKKR